MPNKFVRFKNNKFQPWVTGFRTHELVCATKEHRANILLLGEPCLLVKLHNHYRSFYKSASRDGCQASMVIFGRSGKRGKFSIRTTGKKRTTIPFKLVQIAIRDQANVSCNTVKEFLLNWRSRWLNGSWRRICKITKPSLIWISYYQKYWKYSHEFLSYSRREYVDMNLIFTANNQEFSKLSRKKWTWNAQIEYHLK